ncbi:MAG: hypothetical protein AABM29_00915 [Actinomycetota bacterium]
MCAIARGLDHRANFARTIYGTILSTALIAAYSEYPDADPGQIAVAVVVTAATFWLAHAYAAVLAEEAERGAGNPMETARQTLADEWPLVLGSLPPVLPLLLAPIGLASDFTAEDLAIGTGIALLAGCGLAIARQRSLGILGSLVAVGASASFGLVIVGLKAFVH